MNCSFCATGTMGIRGDLTAGEIVEQFAHARAIEPLARNVVFMGYVPLVLSYISIYRRLSSYIDGLSTYTDLYRSYIGWGNR